MHSHEICFQNPFSKKSLICVLSDSCRVDRVETIDDKADWVEVINGCRIIGLDEGEREDIMQLLAAILHLGNLQFEVCVCVFVCLCVVFIFSSCSDARYQRLSYSPCRASTHRRASTRQSYCPHPR
jgi:hypothetical protein